MALNEQMKEAIQADIADESSRKERLAKQIEGLKSTGKFIGETAVESVPGVSEAIAAKNVSRDLKEGDYVGAGIETLAGLAGLAPAGGDLVAKGLRKFNKTRKAYKLFVKGEDGELYPLFVDANKPVKQGEFLEANFPDVAFKGKRKEGSQESFYVPTKGAKRSKGEKAKGTGDSIIIPDEATRKKLIEEGFITERTKRTKDAPFGRVTAVAARPGWHASQAPVATHLGPQDLKVTKKEVDKLIEAGVTPEAIKRRGNQFYVKRRAEDQVFAEVDMADDVDYQSMLAKEGRSDINDRVPKGGSYRYSDGQADSDQWVVGGDMKVNRVLSREETRAIQKEMGVTDLPYRDEVESILGRKFAKGGMVMDDYLVAKTIDQTQKFAEGGMPKQMELFEDGGLKDEGGMIDEVSGNEVPPGSTREEVRDDIPAQLSEGEFVFPADVVRYYGLETLMKMRQRAKAGLQKMEAMGQMGNSEEATIPDDLPFDVNDLDMEDDGVLEYAQGGVIKAQAGTYVMPTTGGQQQSQFTGYTGQYNPYLYQQQQLPYSPIPQAYTPIQQGVPTTSFGTFVPAPPLPGTGTGTTTTTTPTATTAPTQPYTAPTQQSDGGDDNYMPDIQGEIAAGKRDQYFGQFLGDLFKPKREVTSVEDEMNIMGQPGGTASETGKPTLPTYTLGSSKNNVITQTTDRTSGAANVTITVDGKPQNFKGFASTITDTVNDPFGHKETSIYTSSNPFVNPPEIGGFKTLTSKAEDLPPYQAAARRLAGQSLGSLSIGMAAFDTALGKPRANEVSRAGYQAKEAGLALLGYEDVSQIASKEEADFIGTLMNYAMDNPLSEAGSFLKDYKATDLLEFDEEGSATGFKVIEAVQRAKDAGVKGFENINVDNLMKTSVNRLSVSVVGQNNINAMQEQLGRTLNEVDIRNMAYDELTKFIDATGPVLTKLEKNYSSDAKIVRNQLNKAKAARAAIEKQGITKPAEQILEDKKNAAIENRKSAREYLEAQARGLGLDPSLAAQDPNALRQQIKDKEAEMAAKREEAAREAARAYYSGELQTGDNAAAYQEAKSAAERAGASPEAASYAAGVSGYGIAGLAKGGLAKQMEKSGLSPKK